MPVCSEGRCDPPPKVPYCYSVHFGCSSSVLDMDIELGFILEQQAHTSHRATPSYRRKLGATPISTHKMLYGVCLCKESKHITPKRPYKLFHSLCQIHSVASVFSKVYHKGSHPACVALLLPSFPTSLVSDFSHRTPACWMCSAYRTVLFKHCIVRKSQKAVCF